MSCASCGWRRIGILGGSFDPPHCGHVLLASYALSAAPIDGLLVIPTFAHAFSKRSSPFEDRLAMCAAAFAVLDPGRIVVSDLERALPTPSYTYRTLEALAERHPDATFQLIVGSDLVGELERWTNVDRVRELASFCLVGRKGHRADQEPTLPLELPELSSTSLREARRAGGSIRGRVPSAVADYVESRGLYREEP